MYNELVKNKHTKKQQLQTIRRTLYICEAFCLATTFTLLITGLIINMEITEYSIISLFISIFLLIPIMLVSSKLERIIKNETN